MARSAGVWCRWVLAFGAVVLARTFLAAQTPSAVLFVVLDNENAVATVDPASGKILGRAPTDENPNGVAVSADGKLAFTANLRPGTISVIDVAAGKEARRVNVGRGSQPNDIQVAGGKVYFTSRGFRALGQYDPATQDLAWFGTGQGETQMLAISRDGNRVFASSRESHTLSIIENPLAGPLKWTVTSVPLPGSPDGVDVTPDGREVWAGLQSGGGVSVVDAAARKEAARLQVSYEKFSTEGSQAARLQLTPDGKRAFLLHRPTQELIVFDTAARKELKRFKLPGAAALVAASDSSRVFVALRTQNVIAVIDVMSLQQTGKIDVAGGPNAMAWWSGK